MHAHVDQETFLNGISSFLGCYYMVLALMNGTMALYLWKKGRGAAALLWLIVASVFVMISAVAGSNAMPWIVSFPEPARDMMDSAMGPTVYTVGSFVILLFFFWFRRIFVRPLVAWALLNLSLLAMGFAMTDQDFAAIVTKPDNVPIVGMVFLLGYFTWLGAYKAVLNDDRMKRGEEPLETLDNEKVLVWPDLVYIELICMVVLTAILLLWGIGLMAPLEEPASSVKTPNPSKAPWYFLGLQEMLVYYDPWMAGVVLPSMVVFGLMAIPYIDFNKKGSGYYTIDQRMFAYLIFQFGFLVLWVTLIVMGTFLRGPNWNFFGVFETWDPHKVEALNNVDLSEYFWIYWLGQARPMVPEGAGLGVQILSIIYREWLGIVLVIGYFAALPPAMVIFSKFFRDMFLKMGFLRFMVMTNLLLWMGLLPLKMMCRWTMNMKYFIAIPEYFLNF